LVDFLQLSTIIESRRWTGLMAELESRREISPAVFGTIITHTDMLWSKIHCHSRLPVFSKKLFEEGYWNDF
jgi:hypothetical protein